jgi:hypothetical protein
MPVKPFFPISFTAEIDALLAPPRLSELVPTAANEPARAALESLTANGVCTTAAADRDMAQACLAGLWLYHDFLNESHAISQQIEGQEGSYWHGAMHRREGDYANAKYWFRRVGEHEIGHDLCQIARELAQSGEPDSATDFLTNQPSWDHFRFVDLCQASARGSARDSLCREIQRREWWLLFAYCFNRACGTGG